MNNSCAKMSQSTKRKIMDIDSVLKSRWQNEKRTYLFCNMVDRGLEPSETYPLATYK